MDEVSAKAAAMWLEFNENEKAGVRIGMFPYAKMKAAKDEGYNDLELCIRLMDQAKAHGGMIA